MPNDNKQQVQKSDPPILGEDSVLPPTITTPPQNKDQDIKNPSPAPTDSGSSSPTDDIANIPPVVTGSVPKKKFGGGKVIATILGLFLLIGGLGAGTYLVQQNQDIRERATPGDPPPGCNITPPTNLTITNITNTEAVLNWTPGTGGNYVKLWVSTKSDPTGDCGRLPNKTTDKNCPVNENGKLINGDSNHADIPAVPSSYTAKKLEPNTTYYWRIMMWKESGCDYAAPITSFTTTDSKATPPPIAYCQNIKAYNENWTLLTSNQLSQLKVGNKVNFCVTGVTSSGSFDKAKFTINSVAQAETTSVRPGSTDFCQNYTIPAGVTNFTITAQIHHVTLGWK